MDKKLSKDIEALIESGLVMRAGNVPAPEKIKTGSLMFDYILGGGIDTRRITHFFAKEGTGKSVMAYSIANNALKQYPDSVVVLVDTEHRADMEWISHFIEDTDRLLVMQPEFIEYVGNDLRSILSEVKVSCVIVDSIGAANTTRAKDKDLSIQQVGGNAMGVGVFVRSIVPIANKNNIAIILINQLRDDIGGYGPSIGHFPGGKALAHAINTNVYLRKTSNKVLSTDEFGEKIPVGNEIAFKIVKGKNLGKVAKTIFYKENSEFGNLGFDRYDEVVRLAMALGIIEKHASSYTYEDFPNGKIVGAQKVIDFLKSEENKEILQKLEDKLYSKLDEDNGKITTEEVEEEA